MNLTDRKRTYILDGGFGTMIQKFSLQEKDFHAEPFTGIDKELKGNNECLNLTRPDVVEAIHKEYIAAGADIIETNTFSANCISQAEYGCSAYARTMAREGARIARKAADEAYAATGRKVLVAGSVGPTSKSLTMAPDINDPTRRNFSFDDMASAFREQIEGLIEGGADLILIETCFDALNTKAAIYALEKIRPQRDFPLIVSVSANDRSGRTLTGQTLEAFYTSVKHYPLLAFGINCSLGAEEMIPLVKDIAAFSSAPVSCYPNAGLPNEMGEYDQSPEEMAEAMRKMAESVHLTLAGGCCGTTPAHINAIAEALAPTGTEAPESAADDLVVSGLEAVHVDLLKRNFMNVGERTNVAGSRKFARLIAAGDYDTALQVAADQIEGGADIIDINMDDAMLDSAKEMRAFVRCIMNDPAVAKAALMIDSSHWETILEGLKNAQGKCIVNSISLKEGEEIFLQKAREIRDLGAAVVVMAFDEEGQATDYERKISICERSYKLLTEQAGMRPEDIIFDVNVLSVGTGLKEHARYGIDFIEAVRWIKQNLPGARTSGGISNVSFAFRGNNKVREAMHSVFLYHAIRAGLDMGIVNPGMIQVYDEIEPELLSCVEDVILNRSEDATERLIAKAQAIAAEAAAAQEGGNASVAEESVQKCESAADRVKEALVKGRSSELEADVLECLKECGSAVDVIEGPLMAGMERVGELFGAGKMFLPQVVKSAKLMRDCVAVLQPYMDEADSSSASSRPVIINATVKGDVHDIGKNITGIVLKCNGFDVIDLGVMVDKETILAAATENNAAIIGVSGLITPSLFQMEEICREMTARGMDTPLFIGGATTSALHTAVKLAPLYAHVFYGPDASSTAVMAKRCMMDRDKFEAEEHAAQEKIRQLHEAAAAAKKDSTEAAHTGFAADSFAAPEAFADVPAMEVPVSELVPLMDWRMFLATWGFKYEGAEPSGAAELAVLEDGKAALDRMVREGGIKVMLAAKFDAADTDGTSIYFGGTSLPMLRQEEGRRMSLADFVPDKGCGKKGAFGMFAISVHKTQYRHYIGCTCAQCSDPVESLMERNVRVTVAEAASEWFNRRMSALAPHGAKVLQPAAGYASCPDHTLKKDILALLPDSDKLNISLTESYAMVPDASICGLVIVHPQASFPEIRKISEEQFNKYCELRGMTSEQARQFLGNLL